MHKRKMYFLAALTALLVVGFLATSLTSYFVARDSLSRNISEQMLPLTSDNIYSEIQRDLLRPVLISSTMATDTFVRDWALTGEEDAERIITYLAEIQQEYETITAFYVSETTRHYYHPDGIIKTVTENDPDDAWYFRVSQIREPYEINVDSDTADPSRVSIFINYRVLDYNGRYIGATGVGLSVQAVTRLIDTYQQRYDRNIYFVDRQGQVTLTGTGKENLPRLHERSGLRTLAPQILSSPSVSLTFNSDEGETVYLNSRLVPEFNWYLIVEQTGGDNARSLNTALLTNIGLSGAILLLVLFAAHLTLRSYQGRLEQMATTDQLTGAANRHTLEMLFQHVSLSMARRKRPVSAIIIDIDHFKQVNDTWGHHAGDLVLQSVASMIRSQIRDTDTLARWGGEEFVVLLEDCALDEAIQRAEALRNAARELTTPFGREQIRITLSLGVARLRDGEDLELFMSRADAALYRAKEEGRDRVCHAE